MLDRLERTKNRIDRQFLGRGGIHGVGLRRSKNAVTVYVDPSHDDDVREMMGQLKAQASPFDVIIVPSAPPVARPASPAGDDDD